MGKRRRILVAALVLAALGGLAWVLFFTAESEPVYQGKPLSQWLELYAFTTNRDMVEATRSADNAVRHIGTNAIPTLLRMLQARDSALTLKLLGLAKKQHFVRIHYVKAWEQNQETEFAFRALGAEAKDAVPALMKIYEENISLSSRQSTVSALVVLGPDAKPAVPLLLKVAADTNTPDWKGRMVRYAAIFALGDFHAEPEIVVPALTKALNDPESLIRWRASSALKTFGTEAKGAVPALSALLKDMDPSVRRSAAEAIKKIDPEAAALRKAELDAALVPEKQ